MKKLALCLTFVILSGLGYGQQKSVAVSTFTGGRDISGSDADVVTNFVIGRLTDNGMVRVVDRASFDNIIEEMRFQQSDWSDREKTAALGRAANADYIIRGEINTVDGLIFITARMIDINTAAVVASSDVEMERMNQVRARMPEFVERFIQTLTRTGGSGAPAAPPPAPSALADFVYVQGGTFRMGSPNGDNDERPVHDVTVRGFYMGKHEVTQREWAEVMGANPSNWKGDDLPVETVSWHDAIEYCNKRSLREGLVPAYRGSGNSVTCDFTASGYRLPTEAEWEYAARGGANGAYLTYEYSGSNSAGGVGWYDGNSGGRTHPVGMKLPNDLGLFDMSGNVWEWCWDWYGEYPAGARTDPAGPASGSARVLRGGSWYNSAGILRSANRGNDTPSFRGSNYGFRLVRP
jgi:formylglycine-generating enzyme required for sulfatase activity